MGFITILLDFIFLQSFSFKYIGIAGLILIILGGVIRIKAKFELKKRAGINSFTKTSKLHIIEDQQLQRDGIYKYIRHPLYLGKILRNLGFAVLLSSFYGVLIISLSLFFLLIRIEIEEKRLLLTFGKYYKEYKKKTTKIIPYIY